MPRPKADTVKMDQLTPFTESGDPAIQQIEMPAEVYDLLKFVARTIRVLNMAGKKMDNRCLLCPTARLRKEPCRHTEIWALAENKS